MIYRAVLKFLWKLKTGAKVIVYLEPQLTMGIVNGFSLNTRRLAMNKFLFGIDICLDPIYSPVLYPVVRNITPS